MGQHVQLRAVSIELRTTSGKNMPTANIDERLKSHTSTQIWLFPTANTNHL